jgi:hypothetical protein
MPSTDDQTCVLARDGRPGARADSHGTWLHWLRGPTAGPAVLTWRPASPESGDLGLHPGSQVETVRSSSRLIFFAMRT